MKRAPIHSQNVARQEKRLLLTLQDACATKDRSVAFRIITVLLTALMTIGCGSNQTETDRDAVAKEHATASKNDASQFPKTEAKLLPAAKKTAAPNTAAGEPKSGVASTPLPSASRTSGDIKQKTSEPLASDPPRHRLPKIRVPPDEELLSQHGLKRLESKRLVLITDSDAPELRQLPPLADQLFVQLEQWFGNVLPAADGSEFQVTGYVMKDRSRFRAAGLLPEESFTIRHGSHRRYVFWTGFPDEPYYRRHLALHEFVHCFMMCEQDISVPPPWYIEGMAELFATHSLELNDGEPLGTFGLMPPSPVGFEGWGRIRAFRTDFADADHKDLSVLNITPLNQVVPDRVRIFETPFQYSSSWAVCWFLKHHPDSAAVLPALTKKHSYSEFIVEWERQRNELGNRLAVDWLLFAEQLEFHFDSERSFPVYPNESHSDRRRSQTEHTFPLRSDQGWQNSGIDLNAGGVAVISCTGACFVGQSTERWKVQPDGISLDFYRGHPLGKVVAVVVAPDGSRSTDRISIGRTATLTAPFSGRLWLQVNDASHSRDDNSGDFSVSVRQVP